MHFAAIWFFLTLELLSIHTCSSKLTSGLKNLLYDKFTVEGYDKRIRPVKHQGLTLDLDISLRFSGINSLDEVKGVFTTSGFMVLQWYDSYLSWDPQSYENITEMYLPQNDIWKPDLVLKNGLKSFSEMGGKFYYVYVEHTGLVIWWPFQVFETKCPIDITYFPFDRQTCNITLTIWTHTIYEVNISNSNQGLDFYEFIPSSVWAIDSSSHNIRTGSGESEVTFTFNLSRKPGFYILNLILPILFLGKLNLVVFLIPTQSEEKVAFSITLFLSFAVFLNVLDSSLPENSDNTSFLCLYLVLELTIGVIILIITAIQVRICHRKPSIPFNSFHRKILRLSRCSTCCKGYRVNNEKDVNKLENIKEPEGVIEPVSSPETDWTALCTAIDILAFHTMLVIQVLIVTILAIATYVNR
ncbi:acetylcholine receptor subunit alpha-like [Saccostrea echinata]|uniref:acetylcholine receptor subunit alpha-like n=1 Tax=Saccostrea echinata TaxID=191078 RepID=UPI002A803F1C|nr:acetylcholine receptor subunit alpha-like [Saccostrea echinata]